MMVVLNSRSRDILMLLLQSAAPVSSQHIASQLNISSRMVRYSLPTITMWLESRQASLLVKSNYGIEVQAQPHIRAALRTEVENLAGYQLVLSFDERWRVLVLTMMTKETPFSTTELEKRLGVARTTLFKDLDLAEEWLQLHHLELKRTPGVGISVSGSEHDLRAALEDYLFENVGEIALLDLCSGSQGVLRKQMRGQVGLLRVLREFLSNLDLCGAEQLVYFLEQEADVQFADNSYIVLVIQVAFLLWRHNRGSRIEILLEHKQEVEQSNALQVAQNVARQISQSHNITLLQEEIVYLAMQILGAQTRWTVSNVLETRDALESPKVYYITKQILNTASIYIHPALKNDELLAHTLALHLKTALYRLRFNLPVRNPMQVDTQQVYPYIYQIAQRCRKSLEDETGKEIPKEEIGKIAMHLAAAVERLRPQIGMRKKVVVVCGEGISTAWLVVSRLQAELPEIEVVEIMSVLEVSRKKTFRGELDGMIATVPLKIPGLPIAVVSPMLTGEDKTQIRAVFHIGESDQHSGSARRPPPGLSLTELIRPEWIRTRVQTRNWQEVVISAGTLLLETDVIEETYIQAMTEMIERHGPYIVILPGVALLHARPEDGVKQLCMSLITLDKPVKFGHTEHDPVGIAIALGSTDDHSHLQALLELVDLLQKPENRNQIQQANAPHEILDQLRDWASAQIDK